MPDTSVRATADLFATTGPMDLKLVTYPAHSHFEEATDDQKDLLQ